MANKIIITGGPGTGKTSLITALKANGFMYLIKLFQTA